MLEVSNINVYDLKQSVIASRFAMMTEKPVKYTDELFEKSLPRAMSLCKAKDGSGHKTFLSGIRVSFDLKYPNYISPELQRYHFFDIVTSSSKMHKLVHMNMDMCFNEYTHPEAIALMKRLVAIYNDDPSYENFMVCLSTCPLGIELFMRCSTNYLQLRTIWLQRHNHKLKTDWGAFCDFIKGLPYAKEFKLYEEKEEA